MDIKCPNCKMIHFETTDKYNPDVLPNGAMLQCKPKYKKMGWHNWLPVGKGRSSTMYSGIFCPQCKHPLVVKGRLTVVYPIIPPDMAEITKELGDIGVKPTPICPHCSREFGSQQALKAHMTMKHKETSNG